MNTTRCAKWGKEARFFFENAEDKSVDLDVIISYGCHSQSGEGFEELVNLLNSEPTKRKKDASLDPKLFKTSCVFE